MNKEYFIEEQHIHRKKTKMAPLIYTFDVRAKLPIYISHIYIMPLPRNKKTIASLIKQSSSLQIFCSIIDFSHDKCIVTVRN